MPNPTNLEQCAECGGAYHDDEPGVHVEARCLTVSPQRIAAQAVRAMCRSLRWYGVTDEALATVRGWADEHETSGDN